MLTLQQICFTAIGHFRRAAFSKAARHLRSQAVSGSDDCLIWHGTQYGGRLINNKTACNTISDRDVVFSAGAGEDLSFDLDIQRRHGCQVIIIDPTPSALEHFQLLLQARTQGQHSAIQSEFNNLYNLDDVNFEKIHFVPYALWSGTETLKLWVPRNPTHVSHSVRPGTDNNSNNAYIEVQAKTVKQIMSELEVCKPAILKLDIMGAEIEVLNNLMDDRIYPPQITVKIYELAFPGPRSHATVRNLLRLLHKHGYRLKHFDGTISCLFEHSL